MAIQVLSQGKPATIDGVDFTFVREREFTGPDRRPRPGSPLVWIGSALLVLGMFTVFFFPHRRIRAVIRRGAGGSESASRAIERHDATFAAQFERLVEDIRRAVSGGAQPEKGGTADA